MSVCPFSMSDIGRSDVWRASPEHLADDPMVDGTCALHDQLGRTQHPVSFEAGRHPRVSQVALDLRFRFLALRLELRVAGTGLTVLELDEPGVHRVGDPQHDKP